MAEALALPHRHLADLTLDVAFDRMTTIGETPAGLRRIAPIIGGSCTGARLNAVVVEGADWVINRPDGVMVIDVRLTMAAEDGARIYLTYQGRFLASPDSMARFRRGQLLSSDEYSLAITARFECGMEAYAWLNNAIVVGIGEKTPTGPVYRLFEIG
jgi:hypothetical protein